jgi:hypothetical protein
MSGSILTDASLGETILRDLHKLYSPVTITSADLKVGKKYLCIINDMDEIPINYDIPLKNLCVYILRYKGEKNLSNISVFGHNFDVLEESSEECRLMMPPEVGKEYFISDDSIDTGEVLLYFFDRERLKPYYKRITEQLPIPEDVQKETFKYLYNTNGGKMRKTRRRSKSHKSKRTRHRKRSSKRRQ